MIPIVIAFLILLAAASARNAWRQVKEDDRFESNPDT